MNQMSAAEQFVDSVTKLIREKYPDRTIMVVGDGTNFAWREKLVEKSYAAISVVPRHNRVTLMLLSAEEENQEPQVFECSRNSERQVARAICDWIAARNKR